MKIYKIETIAGDGQHWFHNGAFETEELALEKIKSYDQNIWSYKVRCFEIDDHRLLFEYAKDLFKQSDYLFIEVK